MTSAALDAEALRLSAPRASPSRSIASMSDGGVERRGGARRRWQAGTSTRSDLRSRSAEGMRAPSHRRPCNPCPRRGDPRRLGPMSTMDETVGAASQAEVPDPTEEPRGSCATVQRRAQASSEALMSPAVAAAIGELVAAKLTMTDSRRARSQVPASCSSGSAQRRRADVDVWSRRRRGGAACAWACAKEYPPFVASGRAATRGPRDPSRGPAPPGRAC